MKLMDIVNSLKEKAIDESRVTINFVLVKEAKIY